MPVPPRPKLGSQPSAIACLPMSPYAIHPVASMLASVLPVASRIARRTGAGATVCFNGVAGEVSSRHRYATAASKTACRRRRG